MHYIMITYRDDDTEFAEFATRMVTEGHGQVKQHGRGYSTLFHRGHVPGAQDHVHVSRHNNQLFAINVDGTAHDRSHGAVIPKYMAKALQDTYSGIVIPPNRLIENIDYAIQRVRAISDDVIGDQLLEADLVAEIREAIIID